MGHAEIFNDIYRRNAWGAGSGTGSLPETGRPYAWYLHMFMRTNRVRSVVDIGCGDWQFSQFMNWSQVDYVGVDVSSIALEASRKHAKPGVSFLECDAVNDELPAADLLLAKDVLQHWSNSDVARFLNKLTAFKWALITNGFPAGSENEFNRDISAGDWRAIELSRPPFSLPGSYTFWYQADEPKFVFLWQNQTDRGDGAGFQTAAEPV
jgi:SAM-dependent methyltransferase